MLAMTIRAVVTCGDGQSRWQAGKPPNPSIDDADRRAFENGCRAKFDIELRVGAQVILIQNEPIELPHDASAAQLRAAHRHRLVNGSRGVVVGFRQATDADLSKNQKEKRKKIVQVEGLDLSCY